MLTEKAKFNIINSMKVLLVDVSPFLGGDQKNFVDLCTSLHASGSVEVAAAVNPGPVYEALKPSGVPLYLLSARMTLKRKNGFLSRLFRLFHSSAPISQAIYDFSPDIVHANTYDAVRMIPHLSSRRLLFWHVYSLRLSRSDTVAIANRCARIIAGSTALDEFLGDVLPPAYCGRVRIIRNGIDMRVYKPGDKAAARQAFQLPPQVPVIGLVADLIPWKRHALFLEAAKLIVQQRPEVHFVVAGRSYSGEYERYEKKVAEQMAAFVPAAQLHWVQNVDHTELLLPAFDLLLHPALGEPSGRAVCEAMAMQIPVIAFDSGAIRDLITHRKDGILLSSDSANEFAREALGLLANPDQSATLASAARETMVKAFTKEDMCKRMVGEYKSAIDSEIFHNT